MLLAFHRRLSVSILAGTMLVASFIWNTTKAGTPADFYLPFTRAWELMVGAMMAVTIGQSEYLTSRIRPDFLALAGLGMIAVAVGMLNASSNFPGWWAVLPTLGAALIISSNGSWLSRNILSMPIIVFIGLISYPLYLWHWPLLSFANIIEPNPTWRLRVAMIATAIALAWITYRWIELPIRKGQARTTKIIGLCATMILVGTVGVATFHWRGFPLRLPPLVRDAADVKPDVVVEWRLHKCLLEDLDTEFSPNCLEKGHRPLLFL